jgi:hypothetical protein
MKATCRSLRAVTVHPSRVNDQCRIVFRVTLAPADASLLLMRPHWLRSDVSAPRRRRESEARFRLLARRPSKRWRRAANGDD